MASTALRIKFLLLTMILPLACTVPRDQAPACLSDAIS